MKTLTEFIVKKHLVTKRIDITNKKSVENGCIKFLRDNKLEVKDNKIVNSTSSRTVKSKETKQYLLWVVVLSLVYYNNITDLDELANSAHTAYNTLIDGTEDTNTIVNRSTKDVKAFIVNIQNHSFGSPVLTSDLKIIFDNI